MIDIDQPEDAWAPLQIAYGTSSNPSNWTGYYTNIPLYVGTTNENKTVYIRTKDAGGNTSNNYTNTILLDTQAPYSGSITINNNATATSGTAVTLNIACALDSGAGGVQIAYGSSTNLTNRTGCTTSIPYTLNTTQ